MEIPLKKSPISKKPSSFIIKCTQVPPEFFTDRTIAKRHFRRFGKIRAISFKTKQNICLIEYTNEESAMKALQTGGEYNGKNFKIIRHNSMINSDNNRKKIRLKKPDRKWAVIDPEIRSELEAMSGNFLTTRRPLETKPKITKQQQQINDNSITNEQSDLVEIIIRPAQTIDDKLKILEARDKLLRLSLKKQLNQKIRATIGTCPDMCPEKERLLREIQHQVSIYEQNEINKRLESKLAIKQYSRSSADQEAPLPQELRPVNVLQMTMSYLMHSIMDLCDNTDVNISEWYHFLWDRTRGIRKDITQQELCCQRSVELVEQCARFHIYCSARLINEDPSVFDQKINTENLTKCLQTLKYMYNDLKLKRIECENEAEFRGYIILLNLNDGNFMWEVQQLNRTIQKSQQIQFALQIYSAIDKNNYVRFFKLIKSTTLLNSCVLMRYFIQIRLKAIQILLKSYTSSRLSQITISVRYLYDLLGFENLQQTIDFMQYYGLSINNDKTHVIIDKYKFYLPELPYCLDRSMNLIESKRQHLTVGEIVCGRQLPEKTSYEQHVPQNSFDDNGYLCLDYELKRYLFNDDHANEERKSEETVDGRMEETEQQEDEDDDDDDEQQQEMEEEDEEIMEIAPPQLIKEPPSVIADEQLLQQQQQQQQQQQKQQQQQLEEERRRQDEIRRQFEEKQRLQQLLLEKKRLEELKRAEFLRQQQQKLLAEQERKRKEFELLKQQQQQQLKKLEQKQKEEIHTNVVAVVDDLLKQVESNIINERLVEISHNINKRKLRNFVQKWHNYCLKKRKHKAIIDFQPVILSKSINEQVKDSYNFPKNLLLNKQQRYQFGQIDDIVAVESPEIQQQQQQQQQQLDFNQIYTNLIRNFFNYQSQIVKQIFWKVSINLSTNCKRIEPILNKFLGFNVKNNNNEIVGKYERAPQPILYYCLDKNLIQKNDLNGCIFIDNSFNRQLFEKLTKLPITTPVVLLLEHCDNLKQLHDDLNQLIVKNVITNYCILVNQFTRTNIVTNLEKSLIFLSENLQPSPPPLELDDFQQFLIKQFDGFWCKLHSFTKWNFNYLQLFKQPNLLVYLFNQHLDNLKEICLNNGNAADVDDGSLIRFPDCFKQFLNYQNLTLPCNYQYFPNFWNHPQYRKDLQVIFDNLKLIKFVGGGGGDWPPDSFDDLTQQLRKYCWNCFKKDQQQIYLKLLSLLLRKIDDNFVNIANIIWIDLIELLVTEKLKQIDFRLYGTGFVNNSIYNQFIIVYDVKKLIDYNLTDWFYINHPLIKNQIQELLMLEKREQLKQQKQVMEEREVVVDSDKDDVDWNLLKFNQIKQNSKLFNNKQYCQQLKTDLKRCAELMDDLHESYQIHKKISIKSEEMLKTIIIDK